MARMLSSVTRLHQLSAIRSAQVPGGTVTNISKTSFQYGFKVFLITEVVLVCSPEMVATANGSGNPADSQSADSLFTHMADTH